MTKPSASICGYSIAHVLRESESYLAQMGRRRLVLKRLDPDCLGGDSGKLHPAIRDRLARIQQLADTQVANLYGVERDIESGASGAYMVWDFVGGETLHTWSRQSDLTKSQVLSFASDLIGCVAGLHSWGIVHGAIHANNIIVDGQGRAKLTHVSPLLYSDPQADSVALAEVLYSLGELQGAAATELHRLAEQLLQPQANLRIISAGASTGAEDLALDERASSEIDIATSPETRKRALTLSTVIIAIVLVGFALGKWVRRETVAMPAPPDAAPTALQP